jgi:DNA primase
MLSGKNKIVVITILDTTLGVGSSLKGNEQQHHCPFCHHHKKKLQVNLDTQQWHCWVCNSKGRSISSLLRKLNVDKRDLDRLHKIYGDEPAYSPTEEYVIKLQLPKEFKQLHFKPSGLFNPVYNKAVHYLTQRGITDLEIVKYNIGYCEDGLYSGRIIIPSYDESGELNYFIARSFYEDEKMKYKNPPVNRDVIVFENQINWNEPITLVEGAFDAFSVKRNVIPLLGKFLLSKLKNKIFEKGVKEITIMLDSDAIEDSTKHSEWFMKNGIKVKNIIPTGKDAGELGYERVNQLIKTTTETGWDDLVLAKLNNV